MVSLGNHNTQIFEDVCRGDVKFFLDEGFWGRSEKHWKVELGKVQMQNWFLLSIWLNHCYRTQP
jgi:hypothetical protein